MQVGIYFVSTSTTQIPAETLHTSSGRTGTTRRETGIPYRQLEWSEYRACSRAVSM